MTKNASQVKIVPVTVKARDYPVDEGYTLVCESENLEKIIASAKTTGALIAGTALNFLGGVAVTLHHGHSRPTNPGYIMIEQTYRLERRKRWAYEADILRPREEKVYFPDQFEQDHVDQPSEQKANAWLVTWENNQSILCFSEKMAKNLKLNVEYLPPMIFTIPSDVNWGDVFATSDVDDIHNDIVKRVKENYTIILKKLRTTDIRLFACMGGLNQYGDGFQSKKDYYQELNFGLGRLLALERGNPNLDKDLAKLAYQYLIDMRFLYENHRFLMENNSEIRAKIEKIQETADAALAMHSAYITPVLKQYIDCKFKEIDKAVLDEGLSVDTKLEKKLMLLEAIERVSNQENLYLGVKKMRMPTKPLSGYSTFNGKNERTTSESLATELSVNFKTFAAYMDEKIQELNDSPIHRPF